MNRYITILLFVLFSSCCIAGNIPQNDLLTDTTKAKGTIDEVIKEKAPPAAEKAKAITDFTKYGFKNLFKEFSYNPKAPYSEQVNPHAEIYMQDYLQAHGARLIAMKKTALPYFNFIDHILSMYGLPRELKYLAVIESDLKAGATSWVGARGPWQFMPATARGYGLKVNNNIDERTDYEKSTHAAAKHLLNLYKELKDWLLVIAAYNGGTGRVNSAIKRSGSRDFWKLQYYLPTESKNHVKKFIATHYVMESNKEDGFNYTRLQSPDKTDSVVLNTEQKNAEVLSISGKYKASIIAKNLSMSMVDFDRLNPNLDKAMSSGTSYDLRLPSDKMQLFIANKYVILNQCVQSLLNDVSK
jgi:membrane-bound lytic murein transglycosylase D